MGGGKTRYRHGKGTAKAKSAREGAKTRIAAKEKQKNGNGFKGGWWEGIGWRVTSSAWQWRAVFWVRVASSAWQWRAVFWVRVASSARRDKAPGS